MGALFAKQKTRNAMSQGPGKICCGQKPEPDLRGPEEEEEERKTTRKPSVYVGAGDSENSSHGSRSSKNSMTFNPRRERSSAQVSSVTSADIVKSKKKIETVRSLKPVLERPAMTSADALMIVEIWELMKTDTLMQVKVSDELMRMQNKGETTSNPSSKRSHVEKRCSLLAAVFDQLETFGVVMQQQAHEKLPKMEKWEILMFFLGKSIKEKNQQLESYYDLLEAFYNVWARELERQFVTQELYDAYQRMEGTLLNAALRGMQSTIDCGNFNSRPNSNNFNVRGSKCDSGYVRRQ